MLAAARSRLAALDSMSGSGGRLCSTAKVACGPRVKKGWLSAAMAILVCMGTLLALLRLNRRKPASRSDQFLIAFVGFLSIYEGLKILRESGMVQLTFSNFLTDAIELLVQSGVHYTPTLMVTYGGEALNNYYYGLTNPHDDPKVRRFTPEERMDEGRRWTHVPEDELFFKQIGRDLVKINKAGGLVSLGAHGNRQGVGPHWELWAKVATGATPWEALRDATVRPAEKLALERDLGSLEVGKLASGSPAATKALRRRRCRKKSMRRGNRKKNRDARRRRGGRL